MQKRIALLLLALFAGRTARAEVPVPALQSCATCHGEVGVSLIAKTPHLNGQVKGFLVASMKAFADGSRPTAIAEHKTFPADALEAMAAFYAAQKTALRPRQNTDAALVAKGEKIYAARCADCHIDGGRDADQDAPLMAAQDKEFLATEGRMFKARTRSFPFMMDDSYRGLSDDDLAAVAEYFAAQNQVAAAGDKKKRRRQ